MWFIRVLPFVLLLVYGASVFIAVRTFQSFSDSGVSFAKIKSCYDIGNPALRNACLGKGGKAPESCPAGLIVCGVTNSCLSYLACKAAGEAAAAPQTTPKDDNDEKGLRKPIITTTLAPGITPSVTPKPTIVPTLLPLPTPYVQVLANGKCASLASGDETSVFPCPCGCFSAKQFLDRKTDKCTDMCGATTANKSPTVPPVRTPISQTTPVPSGTYYSQVNNDTSISEDCPRVTFNNVGCGETTTANILTHAGIQMTPEQAAAQTRGGKCNGTTYSQNIDVLEGYGFTADPYTESFKELPDVMDSDDVLWLSVWPNGSIQGHHTYIDGYTMIDGEPVYNLRDPYYGSEMKCVVDGDRAFQCEAYGKQLHISAPPDSDNSGQGTVAVLLAPPEP